MIDALPEIQRAVSSEAHARSAEVRLYDFRRSLRFSTRHANGKEGRSPRAVAGEDDTRAVGRKSRFCVRARRRYELRFGGTVHGQRPHGAIDPLFHSRVGWKTAGIAGSHK